MKTNNTAYSKGKPLATAESVEGKQDKLTAGNNITIENNVISASGGGGSGEVWEDAILSDIIATETFTSAHSSFSFDAGRTFRITYECTSLLPLMDTGIIGTKSFIFTVIKKSLQNMMYEKVNMVFGIDSNPALVADGMLSCGNSYVSISYGISLTEELNRPKIIKIERLVI